MKSFDKKTIVITGASGGIGECLAHDFAKAGAQLILTDINEQKLNILGNLIKDTYTTKVITYTIDVSNQDDVKEFAEYILQEFDKIDVLINNAGIGHLGELAETSIDKWKQLIDVNLLGPIYHTSALLPSMIKNKCGHIVNVSSGQAFYRMPTWGAYSVSKLALGAYSEILRHELRKFNIKVTTCYPFLINTGFYDDVEGDNLFQKLSIKLMPLYSMRAKRVARIIFNATKREKSIEMVSILNYIGKFSLFSFKLWDLMAYAIALTLGKKADEITLPNINENIKK